MVRNKQHTYKDILILEPSNTLLFTFLTLSVNYNYPFMQDEMQRKLWLNAIGWPNAVPTDTTRICSAHFIEGIYRKKGDKAVPTIFPPKPKDWQERHPQFVQDRVKVEPNQELMMVSLYWLNTLCNCFTSK